jgi:hypothetical protein
MLDRYGGGCAVRRVGPRGNRPARLPHVHAAAGRIHRVLGRSLRGQLLLVALMFV